MMDLEVLIKPLAIRELKSLTDHLLNNFDDKFGVVFKGIPLEKVNLILKDLIYLTETLIVGENSEREKESVIGVVIIEMMVEEVSFHILIFLNLLVVGEVI